VRRIVLAMSVSLDGYFAGPDGELDWHMFSEELHWHFNEHLRTMSAFRRLFPPDVHLVLQLVETRTFDNGVVLPRYAIGPR
jgi:hypothetical protein